MRSPQDVSAAVAKLYDAYPFPPEPILDQAPPGYNWRWNWNTAYSFCTGVKPRKQNIRILDAGCGSGVGTEYLLHLNPQAQVIGIDLSANTLKVAQERCERSGVSDRVEFRQLSLFDADQLPGEFDLINCVGVLHHTDDPKRGLQALAQKLAPGGIIHIFVYGELGRWEIQLMQEAIALLQGEKRGDYSDGVKIGRDIFAALPENNRLRKREEERWSIENHRDECFADMYVHPQEIDYNIRTIQDLIQSSGLDFVGFSNPVVWTLDRLIGKNPNLIARAQSLNEWERYRLIELLDPSEIAHYEFFLSKPPLTQVDWSQDEILAQAIPELNPCIEGWPAAMVFNADYQVVQISDLELDFLKLCETKTGETPQTVTELQAQVPLSLDQVRSLYQQKLLLFAQKIA